MASIGKHGATATTPKDILLGAGTFHRGLKWDESKQQWTGEVIGATNGGGKIAIVGELYDLPVDGMLVKTKGFTVKNGGSASMEVNFGQLSPDIIKMATLFEEGDIAGDSLIEYRDKATIKESDYVENFGFVGKTADGSKSIIVIFDWALCTSGFELEGKNKEAAVIKLTMEAYGEADGDLDTLPVRIYYPEA